MALFLLRGQDHGCQGLSAKLACGGLSQTKGCNEEAHTDLVGSVSASPRYLNSAGAGRPRAPDEASQALRRSQQCREGAVSNCVLLHRLQWKCYRCLQRFSLCPVSVHGLLHLHIFSSIRRIHLFILESFGWADQASGGP